jgi:hypothetical protein
MNEIEMDRCKNCNRLRKDHIKDILRLNPEAYMCPKIGMWGYEQMTPLELSVWIEEQHEISRRQAQ